MVGKTRRPAPRPVVMEDKLVLNPKKEQRKYLHVVVGRVMVTQEEECTVRLTQIAQVRFKHSLWRIHMISLL